jgi:hypothetical protein
LPSYSDLRPHALVLGWCVLACAGVSDAGLRDSVTNEAIVIVWYTCCCSSMCLRKHLVTATAVCPTPGCGHPPPTVSFPQDASTVHLLAKNHAVLAEVEQVGLQQPGASTDVLCHECQDEPNVPHAAAMQCAACNGKPMCPAMVVIHKTLRTFRDHVLTPIDTGKLTVATGCAEHDGEVRAGCCVG